MLAGTMMVSRYGGRSEAAVLSMMVGLVAARSTVPSVSCSMTTTTTTKKKKGEIQIVVTYVISNVTHSQREREMDDDDDILPRRGDDGMRSADGMSTTSNNDEYDYDYIPPDFICNC